MYDPEGLIDAELPLDREPHELLAKAVLGWTEPEPALQPRDYQQIALVLTGHARAVAADVQRHAAQLPTDNPRRALADVVIEEAERRLSVQMDGTARCAQGRARMVRALYERLDRLVEPAPAVTS
ncbi:DUF6415 family natural product biosynthesis protein [Streptomyces sp. NPDC054841]